MIEKVEIEKFGGVTSKTVAFAPGLNVLYGPNEAGKSTLIEALYGLFFMPARIKKNRTSEKEFAQKAFPYGKEEAAQAAVVFRYNQSEVRLEKFWHPNHPKVMLKVDGREQIDVDAWLKRYLGYGEGTYNHIVFSKQDEIKRVFQSIKGDIEIAENLNQLLKNAKIQLDGLSIEGYKDVLNRNYQALVSNWDLDRHWPLGNKGIDNPHKRNIGEILSHYYTMSMYERDYVQAEKIEEKRENLQKTWFSLKEKLDVLQQYIENASRFEKDVALNEKLSTELNLLKNSYQEILVINKEWPVVLSNIAEQQLKCQVLSNAIETTKHDVAMAKTHEKLSLAYAQVLEADAMDTKMAEIEMQLKAFDLFNADVVAEIEMLEKTIQRSKNMLSAANLSGRVVKSSVPVEVVDAYGVLKVVNAGETIDSPAFMQLKIGDVATVEIRSKEVDYDVLKEKLEKDNAHWSSQLAALHVESLNEVKQKVDARKAMASEMISLKKRVLSFPSAEERVSIKASYRALPSLADTVERLEQKLRHQETELSDLLQTLARNESKNEIWAQKHISHDALIQGLALLLMEEKAIENQISNLKKPDTALTSQAFLAALKQAREEAALLAAEERRAERALLDCLNELPEKSAEELRQLIVQEKDIVMRLVLKAKKLDKIIQSFQESVDTFMNSGISAFEERMNAYIDAITKGHYRTIGIDATSELQLKNENTTLPIALLSSGTLDATALSFKLAMNAYLDQRELKLTVLDDVLVNMDKERQAQAVTMIQNHAKTHQVVFVTCHESIANQLGGNLIVI